jgi:hypothetical protein
LLKQRIQASGKSEEEFFSNASLPEHTTIMDSVSADFEWVQHPRLFVHRMVKLYNTQELSVREKKVLK